MEAHDKNYFENAWRKAMDGAEIPPDPHVWAGIEKSLNGKSGKARMIFMFKFAIAASLLFAMSTAGFFFVRQYQSTESGKIAVKNDSAESQQQVQGENKMPELMEEPVLPDSKEKDSTPASYGSLYAVIEPSASESSQEEASGELFSGIATNLLNSFREIFLDGFQNPEPVAMQKIPVLPALKKSGSAGTLWAGLNLSGGTMNDVPGSAVSALQVADFENNTGSLLIGRTETNTPGSSVNVGVGLGKKVADRWLIQGGLNFSRRSASGTSNVVAGGNNVALNLDSKRTSYAITDTYEVNHQLSYVTVPVQVGYAIVDKKLDVTLLAGVSGDILVNHRVSDNSGEYASTSLGNDSNFRKYGMSALITTEVSYPLGKHYVVSAYPQVRQYLTPLQKEAGSDDLPVSLEVGFRLSYIF